MIVQLQGRVVEAEKGRVVLMAGGAGYAVAVLEADAGEFQTGEEVLLWVHESVSERGSRLYGFVAVADLQMFERLLTVPRLGPAQGMKILSAVPVAELERAIAAGDVARLEEVKGVGEKLARLICVQLGEGAEGPGRKGKKKQGKG